MSPLETFQALPAGVKVWLLWLFLLQLGTLAFLRKTGARWVLIALVANMASMIALQKLHGGGPHMSIPHLVFWTPLVAYLFAKFSAIRKQGNAYTAWVTLLIGSITASLILDFRNLLIWALS